MTFRDSSSQTLSPMDHTVPKVYFTFYHSFLLDNPQTGVESIQKGLTTLIQHLPFLAKDVAPCYDEKHENVHCIQPPSAASQSIPMLRIRYHLNESIRVMTNTATCTAVEDLQFSRRYAPLPSVMDPHKSQPLLRFVANIMIDGIILSLSFNHMGADGTGIGEVLEILSQCCRNEYNPLSHHRLELQLRRQLSSPSIAGKQPLKSFSETYSEEETFHCVAPDTWPTAVTSMAAVLNTFRFKFTSQKAKILKDACTSILSQTEDASSKANPPFVSSNDVLTALLTICLQQSQCTTEHKEDYTVASVANVRSRMDPPWPDHYLGVMLTMALVTRSSMADLVDEQKASIAAEELGIDKDELVQITNLAANMRQKLLAIDGQYVRGLLAYMQQQRDWGEMKIKGGDVSYSSIRHLKVYDLDFGPSLGKIADFRLYFALLDEFCLILPAAPGGDWDMQISLSPSHQQALMNNELFRWALSEYSSAPTRDKETDHVRLPIAAVGGV
ncbi:O-acetyltransferase [Aspergillus sclerotioniger CBS 115572]|uniref:O-acetyltransferase n=1 Tax=Aspergillus sclerotioniger CBS 115572 TaxID=1450535 RepID=A0A317WWB3_9EURO|nr:O-acetyltransferase [Aspergillus sclerotioniger CBS 115572]PWY89457.1 O-acetyltransferase [Aspergillus sclerotioniger CBS 115572]